MKTRLLVIAFLLSCSLAMAQTDYEPLWDKVSELEEESLPQSALREVDKIYQQAVKEGNSPQKIKALIFMLKYNQVRGNNPMEEDDAVTKALKNQLGGIQVVIGGGDNSSAILRVKDIEAMASTATDKVEQSVLYYMTAQLYYQYYSANAWTINRRTPISGTPPEDVKEWTTNLFVQAIVDNLLLAVGNRDELVAASTADYEAVLTEGDSSPNLRPTMYDFLMNASIESINDLIGSYYYEIQSSIPQSKLLDPRCFLPASEFVNLDIPADAYDLVPTVLRLYHELLQYRSDVRVIRFAPRNPHAGVSGQPVDNSRQATLMVDLDRLDFVRQNYQGESGDRLYLEALEGLKNENYSSGYSVEVMYKEALFHRSKEQVMGGEDMIEYNKKAYDICREGIDRFPEYERIGLLRNLLSEITRTTIGVNTTSTVYPGKELELKINYTNASQATLEIYRIDAPMSAYRNTWNRAGLYEKQGTLVLDREIKLINELPYLSYDTIIRVPMAELGSYEYVIRTAGTSEIANQQFSVTRLASLSRAIDGKREILVCDAVSGKPVEGATVKFYRRQANNQELTMNTAETNLLGLAEITEDGLADLYNVELGEDKWLIPSSVPRDYSRNYSSSSDRVRLALFTDRSLYRPGQTVYFKGIATEDNKQITSVIRDKEYTLSFRDANGKEITSKTFKTNEFGSFSGEFVIPQGLLNGYFYIRSDKDNGSIGFRVEEYKRPTFDMQFLPIEKTYHFGDTVVVRGTAKTFSGVNIQNAEVRYIITKLSHWLDRRLSNFERIAEGTVMTQSTDGSFEIPFVAEKSFEDRNREEVYYNYMVEVWVTHSNGETQYSTQTVAIGDRSMILSVTQANGNWISRFDELSIQATNLDSRSIRVEGSFEIFSLKPQGEIQANLTTQDWETDKRIYQGTFTSGEKLEVGLKKLPASGRYRLVAKAKDDQGREVETTEDFTLAGMKDKKPPVPVYQWLMAPDTKAEVGETVEIIYGSGAKDVHVLYEIFHEGKKLSASRFVLNNENRKIRIPFLESYGDGISVQFTFIKDSRVFSREVTLYKKQADKTLNLTMETFRDRLLPGQQEEWRISIRDADRNPVVSELLASMYDASLDKIRSHSWSFNPIRSIFIRSFGMRTGNEFQATNEYLTWAQDQVRVPDFAFQYFNWFGFQMRNPSSIRIRGAATMNAGGSVDIADLQDHKVIVQADYNKVAESDGVTSFESSAKEVVQSTSPESSDEPSLPVQVRENFNETAYFYPQLRTNEQGETLISFTVPESNTTWKFMALAHTQDLKHGQLIKEAISQKRLMVAPNMPRFLREGDQASLTATIANLSEETLSGQVSLECFDPNTGRQTIVVDKSSLPFTVEPGQTIPVNWSFRVPSGLDMTAIKVVAISSSYSDGEQHLIPVLPNRMLVTESLPMNVRGNESKTFSFDRLVNNTSTTLENYRLTLEFAGNPIWYAVQALPSMQEPQSDNAVAWFSALYANSLATQIANSTPRLKAMIDTWTRQGGSKETLVSNLEKNQELKAILLEETPWVTAANNETEQKQRLSLLFDINRNANLNRTAIDKLQSTQREDGGWSWFQGMGSSVGITQYILYGIGNLTQLDALPDGGNLTSMQGQAIQFIDTRFGEAFEDLKKYNSNWKKTKSLSSYALEYLYVRSFFGEIEITDTSASEAVEFYIPILEKYWINQKTLYQRSIAATILNRHGKQKAAQSIIKSLREHAVQKNELGMYWANNTAYTFFFQSATATHTFIMEAFQEVGSTEKEMDEMKLWLLKQKQTQVWESTPATVNAINILLKTGSNWLDSPGKVSIRVGSQSFSTETGEAGTGYIKEAFEARDITPHMGKVEVSKADNGPAWGAMYWQYFEDLDKITSAKTELNVEKSLFIEEITATGKSLVPAQTIRVGDKVTVRLVVRVDRDMEYVMLKDMRAGCMEPADQVSGLRWKERVVYYQSTKDASTNFYFYNLPKGTYVFEYALYASAAGEYSTGNATIQCLYAPEYISHTAGSRIKVEK